MSVAAVHGVLAAAAVLPRPVEIEKTENELLGALAAGENPINEENARAHVCSSRAGEFFNPVKKVRCVSPRITRVGIESFPARAGSQRR